ncbi:thiamine phosphate synthase [Mycetocola tolaasinivorans]|uniref:Thiamine-phosphate synthase n=1 Tax=Mycetocola tolaasinivorans TaxID=76635 RepID=A0A3L7A1L9_9MICO|nr:thiamine phosphate synthase [Mycetocola tolaasinivorans]RLP74119.1 thiamine phosphate synthase [Mycetocola tolaasinivorans]
MSAPASGLLAAPDLSVYLVTDTGQLRGAGHDPVGAVLAAVAGGVSAVQVREKDAATRDFLAYVEALAERLPAHIPLIVNDRVDVFLAARVRAARVSGVHVGQSDLPVTAIRALIGTEAILGLSASTPEELAAAEATGVVDHVGIGPLHSTTTKTDAPAGIGLAETARLVAGTALPAVAIGGITAADLPGLRAAGLVGAAAVSAICAVPDPEGAARELRAAWGQGVSA